LRTPGAPAPFLVHVAHLPAIQVALNIETSFCVYQQREAPLSAPTSRETPADHRFTARAIRSEKEKNVSGMSFPDDIYERPWMPNDRWYIFSDVELGDKARSVT
jgi:hypothetical protein